MTDTAPPGPTVQPEDPDGLRRGRRHGLDHDVHLGDHVAEPARSAGGYRSTTRPRILEQEHRAAATATGVGDCTPSRGAG